MKIGILTYQRAHNYGALLQAYALRTYLHNLGHDVEIIDYWPKYHNEDYKLIPYFSSRRFLGKIKAIFLLIIGYSRITKRRLYYNRFMQKYLDLGKNPMFTTKDEISILNYDIVVYGSDQIWRKNNYPIFKGYSEVFFGVYPKGDVRKITYAASMGILQYTEQDKSYLKQVLQNFDELSVRESDLKLMVENITSKTIPLVLDPVFLLDKYEWIESLNIINNKPSEKYILFYQLLPSKDAIKFTNRLRDYYGYKVIEIRGRVESLLFGERYQQTVSPVDFISLIRSAEIVVSTSFHGIAFSIVFEKQFFALGMGNNSERVKSLLNYLGINNRYLNEINDDIIDYRSVRVKLKELRNKSINYLKNAVS